MQRFFCPSSTAFQTCSLIAKRLLHIIDSLAPGGAEKLLCSTIAGLPEYEHLVVTVFDNNDFSMLPAGIPHASLGAQSKAGVIFKGRMYKNILRQFAPDLVHAHLYFGTLVAKAFTPASLPLLFTMHFEFSKNAGKWHYSFADRQFSHPRQLCIAISEAVKKDYLHSTGFKGKTVVINNFVEEKFFQKKRKKIFNGSIKMVAVGNIKPIKNQNFLVEAFTHLRDLPLSCDVYGEGPQKQGLQQQAADLKINVNFKGAVQDPSEILADYDLFIMPSLTEGFGLAVFEAMASGLPIVVSDIPVFRELVADAANYLNLSEPASLRPIVENYLQHPEKLEEDGNLMRSIAEKKASSKKYFEKLREVYQQMLALPKTKAADSCVV